MNRSKIVPDEDLTGLRYRAAQRLLARAALLREIARNIHAKAPRNRIDTATLLMRAFEILRRVEDDAGVRESAHVARTRELALRHLVLGGSDARDVRSYEAALAWGVRWQRSVARTIRKRASHEERAREVRDRRREVAFRGIATALGLLIAFAVGEVAVRAHFARSSREAMARAALLRPPPVTVACTRQGRQASLGEIVRPTDAMDVVYELKPNVDTCFKGVRVTTNAEGQRASQSYTRPRPADVYRVLVLGDSLAFGWGAPYEETLAVRLRESLEGSGGRRVEVVNAAVPGYNTTMEVAAYVASGATYGAQCVIVLFCGNDFAVPFLMRENHPPPWHGSLLVGTVLDARRPAPNEGGFRVADGPLEFSTRDDDIEGVPDEYRHMVGVAAYRRAISSLAAAAAKTEATVVEFADYRSIEEFTPSADLVAFQRELGIVVPPFRFPDEPRFRVSTSDFHPNGEGHAVMAREMLEGLRNAHACMP